MNRITKGEGGNGKIYERLRKASYRRYLRSEAAWDAQYDWEDSLTEDEWETLHDEIEASMKAVLDNTWTTRDHSAYLAGVRDALIANEKAWRPVTRNTYDTDRAMRTISGLV